MLLPNPERLALAHMRGAIDRVDDGLIVLLAARRRLVRAVAALKPRAGVPPRDLARERRVRTRAQSLAHRLDLPADTATGLLDLAIVDACRQQGMAIDFDQGGPMRLPAMMQPMSDTLASEPRALHLLRLLPPPRRFAPLLRVLPLRWQHALLERAMARVLAVPLGDGTLDFMRGRRLGIEVSDLQLRWVLELHDSRLCVGDGIPEASVRGSATDLLLLASRLEDADTLFFQRALELTGDTELGLTARNLLERLPWESVPLGLRIALNRGARFARAAREAHRRQD
ncbi:ubiquinone anaerobic biosynthesis accessory factor UbiT [Rhodanobacter terrae]|uniref:chorismate mutase n=1 Tax=Rhodanobacter terrae TaxID=418647 RepID=A0ABW0SXX1_9GAMM